MDTLTIHYADSSGGDNPFQELIHHPLLTAQQEKSIDLHKWAAVRGCLRTLLGDGAGRQLIVDLCQACLSQPPQVQDFSARGVYFQLRKDIIDMLPGHTKADSAAELIAILAQPGCSRSALEQLEKLAWPSTLGVGLAVVALRQLGMPLRDSSADALLAWQPAWGRARVNANLKLAARLNFYVQRYLRYRDKLVLHNARLAMKLAREQHNPSIPVSDLLQEGMAGLVRAAEKYDYRLGYRFSTYAYNWINQYIQRACAGNGSLISYPSHVNQEISQLHKARLQHYEHWGQEPDYRTLAAATGFKEEKVSDLRRLTNLTVPLDQPLDDDSEQTLASILADPNSDRSVHSSNEVSVQRLLKQRLDKLESLEQAVIRGHWGLDGNPALTFAQLADQLAVSREWVRQLEKSALRKLSEDASLRQAMDDFAY